MNNKFGFTLVFACMAVASYGASPFYPFAGVDFAATAKTDKEALRNLDSQGSSIVWVEASGSFCAYYYSQRDPSAFVTFCKGASTVAPTLMINRLESDEQRQTNGTKDSVRMQNVLESELTFLKSHGVIDIADGWISSTSAAMQQAAASTSQDANADIYGVVFDAASNKAEMIAGGGEGGFLQHLPKTKALAGLTASIARQTEAASVRVKRLSDGSFRVSGISLEAGSFALKNAAGASLAYRFLDGQRILPTSTCIYLVFLRGRMAGKSIRLE